MVKLSGLAVNLILKHLTALEISVLDQWLQRELAWVRSGDKRADPVIVDLDDVRMEIDSASLTRIVERCQKFRGLQRNEIVRFLSRRTGLTQGKFHTLLIALDLKEITE